MRPEQIISAMISFESDYDNGCLPEILQKLSETNGERTSGYGNDPHTEAAVALIREAAGLPEADVFLLVGGTQTNATMIDSMLGAGEGVLCVPSAHIEVHEAGAVEAFGHKVITTGGVSSGKLTAEDISAYMETFLNDESHAHMVQPGLVYISMPTELGEVYKREELGSIYNCCRRYGLRLYIDGARLGYGLCSPECDYDLGYLAGHCHAFYIGGTKVGAMMGEAVVFSGMKAPRCFLTGVKRHGALLAKGRMLGIQFETLFTGGLYMKVSRHAVDMAMRLKEIFLRCGIELASDSPTNQQFVILDEAVYRALSRTLAFEIWEKRTGGRLMCRFVTSWATTDSDLEAVESALKAL